MNGRAAAFPPESDVQNEQKRQNHVGSSPTGGTILPPAGGHGYYTQERPFILITISGNTILMKTSVMNKKTKCNRYK